MELVGKGLEDRGMVIKNWFVLIALNAMTLVGLVVFMGVFLLTRPMAWLGVCDPFKPEDGGFDD